MKSFLKTLLAAFIGALAAIAVSFVILLGMASVLISIGQKSETSSFTGEAILKLDLSKPITERSNNDPFSSISLTSFRMAEESTGILTAVTAIENAAADPRIKFIYVNASGVALGMTALEEVRSALVKFRDSGKPIVAYADNFSQGGYYIASVADKIYMNRDGQAMMTGIGMNLMFFKDLLDKLGVEVQLIRHGKFKAAAEQFVSNNISEANREQNQAMVDQMIKDREELMNTFGWSASGSGSSQSPGSGALTTMSQDSISTFEGIGRNMQTHLANTDKFVQEIRNTQKQDSQTLATIAGHTAHLVEIHEILSDMNLNGITLK